MTIKTTGLSISQIGTKRLSFVAGYLFEKKNSSPFGGFVSTILDRRQEAKRTGNDAMSYVYKRLINSAILYIEY